jgi:hypothetical protein
MGSNSGDAHWDLWLEGGKEHALQPYRKVVWKRGRGPREGLAEEVRCGCPWHGDGSKEEFL